MKLLRLAALAALTLPVYAQTLQSGNMWLVYNGDHPIARSKWGAHLEGQLRRSDMGLNWQQLLLRPAVNYQLTKTIALSGGYTFLQTHPWGTIPGTNQWINYRTLGKSDPGAGPTTNQTLWYLYRVRFTVPADAVNPKMTFSLKADNFAQVAINGNLTGGSTRFINGANMPNVIEG